MDLNKLIHQYIAPTEQFDGDTVRELWLKLEEYRKLFEKHDFQSDEEREAAITEAGWIAAVLGSGISRDATPESFRKSLDEFEAMREEYNRDVEEYNAIISGNTDKQRELRLEYCVRNILTCEDYVQESGPFITALDYVLDHELESIFDHKNRKASLEKAESLFADIGIQMNGKKLFERAKKMNSSPGHGKKVKRIQLALDISSLDGLNTHITLDESNPEIVKAYHSRMIAEYEHSPDYLLDSYVRILKNVLTNSKLDDYPIGYAPEGHLPFGTLLAMMGNQGESLPRFVRQGMVMGLFDFLHRNASHDDVKEYYENLRGFTEDMTSPEKSYFFEVRVSRQTSDDVYAKLHADREVVERQHRAAEHHGRSVVARVSAGLLKFRNDVAERQKPNIQLRRKRQQRR